MIDTKNILNGVKKIDFVEHCSSTVAVVWPKNIKGYELDTIVEIDDAHNYETISEKYPYGEYIIRFGYVYTPFIPAYLGGDKEPELVIALS